MPQSWLPGNRYERLEITSCTGPGTMVDGYQWRFVLHTTESAPGSIDGVNNLFRAKPCNAPHLCIDPMGTRRRVQYIPLDWSACALKGGRGGWQTNRGRAIQMEICGRANETPGWDDDTLYQIAEVIADVIIAGYPINPDDTPDMRQLTGVLATENAAQRMTPEAWQACSGITAHAYAPFNDHYDAYRINSHRIRDLVHEILGGEARPLPGPAPGPGAGPPVSDGMLQAGMSGGIIKMLQELLIGMGYDPGPADGDFGPRTDAAVRAMQADHGLDVDGIAGPATLAAISEAYAWARTPTPPPPAPSTPPWPGRYLVLCDPMVNGADVTDWQRQMAARGWPIGADGWYGNQSHTTCTAFQREKALAVDGVVGPATWTAAWTAPVT